AIPSGGFRDRGCRSARSGSAGRGDAVRRTGRADHPIRRRRRPRRVRSRRASRDHPRPARVADSPLADAAGRLRVRTMPSQPGLLHGRPRSGVRTPGTPRPARSTVKRLARAHSYALQASLRTRGLKLTLCPQAGEVSAGRRLRAGIGASIVVAGRLEFGDDLHLEDGAALYVAPGAALTIGRNVYVGRSSVVAAVARITIGNDVMIGEHCSVRDSDHRLAADERARERAGALAPLSEPVELGDDVWLGAGVRVLRGTVLAKGCVAAANTVARGAWP